MSSFGPALDVVWPQVNSANSRFSELTTASIFIVEHPSRSITRRPRSFGDIALWPYPQRQAPRGVDRPLPVLVSLNGQLALFLVSTGSQYSKHSWLGPLAPRLVPLGFW